MNAGDIVFYAGAVVAVGAALLAVTRRNPIYSALYLLAAFLAFAVIYLLLDAPFLAAMHVVVYTGAILVLFLFVIMLLNLKKEELAFDYPILGRILIGVFAAAAGLFVMALSTGVFMPSGPLEPAPADFGGATSVGRQIMTYHLFPFELVSILIIAAMVGAIQLAMPTRKPGEPPK